MALRANKIILLFWVGCSGYITLEVLFRGFSFPLMGVFGGLSVLLLDKINDKISWDFDLILQGFLGSSFITVFELIVGELAKRVDWLPVMWDYTNMPLNFDGVICLPFSLLWVLLSIFAIWIADAIGYYVFEDTQVPYYRIFGRVVLRFPEKTCHL